MHLPLPRAAALLLGAGGAGAVTMLALLLSDVQGAAGGAVARVGALGFAFLLTFPLVLATVAMLREDSGASRQLRSLATFGAMLWLLGLGGDLFLPSAAGMVLLWHSLAFVGAVAFTLAGLAGKPLSGLREGETPAARRRRLRGEG